MFFYHGDMDKLVSVIIPTYNRFYYLQNAINSVLNQTYKNFEIIVINDGSEQKEYYENKLPDNINLITFKENHRKKIGFVSDGYIRNFGIKEANGEYLAFLDDDDMWLPDKLEVQLKAILESDIQFSSTEGYWGKGAYDPNKKYLLYNQEKHFKIIKNIYKNSKFSNKTLKNFYRNNFSFPKIWDHEFLKIHNCCIASSVMVNKELLDTFGNFRAVPSTNAPDYDCWLGLIQMTDLIYVDQPLFYFDDNHGDGRNW